MKRTQRSILVAAATAAALSIGLSAVALTAPASAADAKKGGPTPCRGIDKLRVPGAERLEAACLTDLTTAGTVASGHTDLTDGAGLSIPGAVNPTGVPGIQLDGYFPDTSTFNTAHGWNHDAQFVIRMPQHWNGGLVVAGPPGVRRQYANDFTISDWVLAKGYAYASTDKGNSGTTLYQDGKEPGDAIAEWHSRVTELTVAAKKAVKQRYDHGPRRTYIVGNSAAGYLTRWQLENRPELYDGGVEWNSLLMTPDRNLLTYLPTALKNYPAFAAGSEQAHQNILAAGFPAGSEPTWGLSNRIFWDPIQRTLREELDPTFDGDLEAGHPGCATGTPDCDADYVLSERPAQVKEALARIALTGRIGKPLLTLQGTLDTAVTPRDTDLYASMIKAAGRQGLSRVYQVEGGNHFEATYGAFPSLLRPMTPCEHDAFEALEDWTQDGTPPPPSHFIARDGAADLVNTCNF